MRKIVLFCITIVMMVSCKKEDSDTEYKYMELINSTLELTPTMERQIRFKQSFTNPDEFISYTSSFTWESEDENIATVNNSGMVTGMSVGTTNVIAKYKGKEWTCNIVVSNHIPFDPVITEYLIEKGYDTNNDALISVEEAFPVSEIMIRYKTVTSLDGIEFTPQIKQLGLPSFESFTIDNLNLRKNTNLEYISINSQNRCKIEIGENSNLKHLEIKGYCFLELSDLHKCHNLEVLYYSHNKNYQSAMSELKNFPDLKYLDYLDFTKIDFANFPKLTYLSCSGCEINSLDLKNNIFLNYLECADNPIKDLNVMELVNLEDLYCSRTLITNLDLRNNTKLDLLECSSLNSVIMSQETYDKYMDTSTGNRFYIPINAVVSVAE